PALKRVDLPVDHAALARSRRFLAASPAQRGLVEDDIRAIERRGDGLSIPDVELAQARLPGLDRRVEILRDATHEGVERDDLARAGRDGRVNDVGADIAGTTGDHY